jgi:hypothetical protein
VIAVERKRWEHPDERVADQGVVERVDEKSGVSRGKRRKRSAANAAQVYAATIYEFRQTHRNTDAFARYFEASFRAEDVGDQGRRVNEEVARKGVDAKAD